MEYGAVSPEKDGNTYEVKLTPERISNPEIRVVISHKIEKYGPDYLENLWKDATKVDIMIDDQTGQSVVSIRTNDRDKFLSMSAEDFSAFLSVPLTGEKDAIVKRVLMPRFSRKMQENKYLIYRFFSRVKVDGQPVGALNSRNINVYLRKSDQSADDSSNWVKDYIAGTSMEPKLWQEELSDPDLLPTQVPYPLQK